MGATSHGHCIVGFDITEGDLVDLKGLGLKCSSCGPIKGGKFCSNCGRATRAAFKRSWNDRAVALAAHLKVPLTDELYEASWFECFYNHTVRTDDEGFLGVLLPPGAYDQEVIEAAFEKARVLAKIVFPNKDVIPTLWWCHDISW
jgi:hypothetical protein